MPNPDRTVSSSSMSNYKLVNQLLKTPAHISIFKLLQISLEHKEILTKALVPNGLDMSRFQNMVSNLVAPHCVSFSAQDDMFFIQPQNSPLHIEVFIHMNWVKRALVDGGVGLNICTLILWKPSSTQRILLTQEKRLPSRLMKMKKDPPKAWSYYQSE